MMCIDENVLQWELGEESHQELWNSLFKLPVEVDPSTYVHAPVAFVHKHTQSRAVKRFLPCKTKDGKNWSPYQVSSPGNRYRILGHRQSVREAFSGGSAKVFYNAQQHTDYMPFTTYVTTILRRSEVWCHSRRRFFHSAELFELMTARAVFVKSDYDHRDSVDDHGPEDSLAHRSRRYTLMAVLKNPGYELTEKRIKSMMGNGMHVPSVGAAFFYIAAMTSLRSPLRCQLTQHKHGIPEGSEEHTKKSSKHSVSVS